MVLGKKDGALSKGELKAAGMVLAKLENFDFEAKATVQSFTFSAVIGGDFKEYKCTGGSFSSEVSLMMSAEFPIGILKLFESAFKIEQNKRIIKKILFSINLFQIYSHILPQRQKGL